MWLMLTFVASGLAKTIFEPSGDQLGTLPPLLVSLTGLVPSAWTVHTSVLPLLLLSSTSLVPSGLNRASPWKVPLLSGAASGTWVALVPSALTIQRVVSEQPRMNTSLLPSGLQSGCESPQPEGGIISWCLLVPSALTIQRAPEPPSDDPYAILVPSGESEGPPSEPTCVTSLWPEPSGFITQTVGLKLVGSLSVNTIFGTMVVAAPAPDEGRETAIPTPAKMAAARAYRTTRKTWENIPRPFLCRKRGPRWPARYRESQLLQQKLTETLVAIIYSIKTKFCKLFSSVGRLVT